MDKNPNVFSDAQNSEEILSKTLKVVNKPYQKTYVNGLNLQGKYFQRFGFELGDPVSVEVSMNRILIKKIIS